ncbi:MAG: hypothetical protein AMJ46_14300, partial [Latescibacteria bacterium DG_63]
MPGAEVKHEVLLERLRKNHLCIVAENEGTIIGYEWAHVDSSHYQEDIRYLFRAGPGSVWCYDAYVSPAYRRKGVWRGIQTGIITLLGHSLSYYAVVDFTNPVSVQAHLKYGFRALRQLT